jgi:hypothetical protein
MTTKILVIALAPNLDILGELSSIMGDGYEITFIRGADRQKLDMALDGHIQYDIVHIMAHGCAEQLGASDGPVSESEIVSMLESQTGLSFAVVAACDSYEIVGGIHNILHIPVIGYNAPIDDRAAIEFSRAFYRAMRRHGGKRLEDIGPAVARARESLAVLYPSEARKVRLINGVSIVPIVAHHLNRVDTQLTAVLEKLGTSNAEISANMKITAEEVAVKLKQANLTGLRWQIIISVLLLLLIIAQFATPFIASLLRMTGK